FHVTGVQTCALPILLATPFPPIYFTSRSFIMTRFAHRIDQALTFHAVEVTKAAQQLREQGQDIISLGIGEPDFTAPSIVVDTLRSEERRVGKECGSR